MHRLAVAFGEGGKNALPAIAQRRRALPLSDNTTATRFYLNNPYATTIPPTATRLNILVSRLLYTKGKHNPYTTTHPQPQRGSTSITRTRPQCPNRNAVEHHFGLILLYLMQTRW
jgi:hypothetical protein